MSGVSIEYRRRRPPVWVSFWVIAAGQERSPGPWSMVQSRLMRLPVVARCQMAAARGSSTALSMSLVLRRWPIPGISSGIDEGDARLGSPWLRLLGCGSSLGQGFSERDVDGNLETAGRCENWGRRPMTGQPTLKERALLSAVCVWVGVLLCAYVHVCLCVCVFVCKVMDA